MILQILAASLTFTVGDFASIFSTHKSLMSLEMRHKSLSNLRNSSSHSSLHPSCYIYWVECMHTCTLFGRKRKCIIKLNKYLIKEKSMRVSRRFTAFYYWWKLCRSLIELVLLCAFYILALSLHRSNNSLAFDDNSASDRDIKVYIKSRKLNVRGVTDETRIFPVVVIVMPFSSSSPCHRMLSDEFPLRNKKKLYEVSQLSRRVKRIEKPSRWSSY